MLKKCAHCNLEKNIKDFYKIRNKYWNYCRNCESLRKKQQLINFKRQCLDYKKQHSCYICGYDKNITALDFHHTNSSIKDFTISSSRKLIINDLIKKELDKCVVVCSNCHREIHSLEEGNFSPNKLNPSTDNHCIDCDIICSKDSQRCQKCFKNWQAKVQSKKPPKEQLLNDIKQLKSYVQVSKKYNVSDNTIKKWCLSYDFDKSAGRGN